MKQYCLDTNVLIEAWNKYYSMEICPDYWMALADFASQGAVFCPMEVKREITKMDDGLAAWIKDKPQLFREASSEVQENLRMILQKYPRLVDNIKTRSIADPWVIAHALAEKAVVVTKEEMSPNDSKRIKIPDVCKALKIEWVNDFKFLSAIGIKFALADKKI